MITPRLVTTALSEKIAEQDEIVLLGEWCCLYGSGDTARESAPVIPYHWDDREKLARDFEFLQSTNRTLLKDLTGVLNELHGVSYSERYWELLLGYWLNLFTSVLFDRWSCLNEAVAQFDKLKTVIYPVSPEMLVPKDTIEANHFFLEDCWNHALYGQLIDAYHPGIEVVVASDEWIDDKRENCSVTRGETKRVSLKRRIKRSLNAILGVTAKWNRYTLVESGLQLRQETLLALRLGCIPYNMSFPEVKPLPLNPDMRIWSIVGNSEKSSFEEVVRTFLPQMIPKVFLEGFKFFRQVLDSSRYSRHSKAIFTSYSHFTNDVFKMWAGNQREQGARLVIGQHGGGAFHKFNGATSYELSISDAYVSTGSGNSNIDDRIKDLGRFNNRVKTGAWDPNGHATMVTVAMPRYAFDIRAMPIAAQMLPYFGDQFLFYEKLSAAVRARLQVRLYPADYGWNQKKRWLDRFPEVLLDDGQITFEAQVAGSRLIVVAYNATTYNESLSANVPTVLYWDPQYWELSESAQTWFDELKSVGISHENPESAASHVNKIWDDVRGWWQCERVQEVRARYCRRYAYLPPNVLSSLANVIKCEGAGSR